MVPGRVPLLLALLLGVSVPPALAADGCRDTCPARVVACRRVECAGSSGRERRRCIEACKGRHGCGAARIRTLAYAVSRCRVSDAGALVEQELLIRRGGCEPVTVARFVAPARVPDPLGLCALFGERRYGVASVIAGVVQRLGVTPDGSHVVFEVNNAFQLLPRYPLTPEQQGFFVVRANGTGLRRIAPPSRNPAYRIFGAGGLSATFEAPLPFSPTGRRLAYADLGPGPSGEEAVQIFVMDRLTGARRQLTRLPAPGPPIATPYLADSIDFRGERTIVFSSGAFGPRRRYTIGIDGNGMRTLPDAAELLPEVPEGGISPTFEVTSWTGRLVNLRLDRAAENEPPNHVREVFYFDGRNMLQLSDFGRADTSAQGVTVDGRGALFIASDRNGEQNPSENCQVFSADVLGGRLRQLTHFREGERSLNGCRFFDPPGCGVEHVREDPVTRTLVFHSSCDPFGTNPNGYQVFAIRPDGSGLSQLTHTGGYRRAPDGSFGVENPGPIAYPAPPG